MYRTITLFVLLMLVSVAVAYQTTAPLDKAAITQAVLAANAKATAAANSMDADKFFEHIIGSEPGCIINDGRLYHSREEALADVRMGFEATAEITRSFDKTHVTVLSADTALLTATGTTHVTRFGGGKSKSAFAVSQLFVKKDGEWKIKHGHFSEYLFLLRDH